uniref:Uncharacterized protein n=1 Tax=Dromaius novaehollandiae TaxID=8790 RepID=A0A8C4JML8_DRONO
MYWAPLSPSTFEISAQGLRQQKPSVSNRVQTTNTPIHWYPQKPGEAPKCILCMATGEPVFDEQADKEMFWVEKKMSNLICTLTIKRITKQQEASYYFVGADQASTSVTAQVS